uniref:Acetyl-coenzyme A carboxylase carboxyl transferase subunit beta, chloroplastic n=1 Tax=Medicago ruthenica TaxID=70973 RepID=A0A7L8XSH4_9FABA|nr:acetyl-CoA carboxylase carboxyltransferase beta subunit [Medicago ruthenica]QOI00566.1 acetyl-CoA carboxylase carboxyltransferase beta subunit [Medicago ruthenica]
MEKCWFNSMMFNRGLEYRCGLSKSIDSIGPIENNSVNEDPSILTDSENSSYSDGDYLVDVLSDKTLLVSNIFNSIYYDSFSIYYGIESQNGNQFLEIDNNNSFSNSIENEPESFVYKNSRFLKGSSSILKNVYKSNDHNDNDRYDTNYNWNNTVNNSIESYLRSEIRLESYLRSSMDNSIIQNLLPRKKYDYNYNPTDTYIDSNDLGEIPKIPGDYSHLWVRCDNEDCLLLNYKSTLKSNKNICEYCGSHLKMSSSDRIELLIDRGTWNPMDEDMVSVDPIEFDSDTDPTKDIQYMVEYIDAMSTHEQIYYGLLPDSDTEDESDEVYDEVYWEQIHKQVYTLFDSIEEMRQDLKVRIKYEPAPENEPDPEDEPYINRLDSYQNKTGLLEAVQTGTGKLNGIPVAIGIMDFQFLGGSMGSVVGEKITRLIEYATNEFLPLIIVCASGGARMQEGSLSLMQMAKISSALYKYQINRKLFYVPILTSPTTGGVTASFGMLGDIIIAEPDAYIAFAGKRVIEQTLNKEVPEGSQSSDLLFEKGLFDSIVPRPYLKLVLSELLQLHGFFPLAQTEK